jgi:SAM-dependent methyltransferase
VVPRSTTAATPGATVDYQVAGKPAGKALEGAPLDAWLRGRADLPYATDPAGFDVFLPPEQLDRTDEYATGDPYGVDETLSSPFHRGRIDAALEQTLLAVGGARSPVVLDLGCGEGHLLRRVGEAIPGAVLVGLDYSRSAIARAKQIAPGAQLVVADANQCPFPDQSFDVVLCTNLWEHVDAPVALARGIRRLLKPGGQLILSTPARYRLQNLRRVLAGNTVGFMSPMHVTEYSVGQVKEMLAFAGLDIVELHAPRISRHFARAPRRAVMRLAELALGTVGSHHVLEPTFFVRATPRPEERVRPG